MAWQIGRRVEGMLAEEGWAEEVDWAAAEAEAARRASLFLAAAVEEDFWEKVPMVVGRRMMVDSCLDSLARRASSVKADSRAGILSVGFWREVSGRLYFLRNAEG